MILDYSLRLPCGPPFGRSMRYALLSRLRGNDALDVTEAIFTGRLSFPHRRKSKAVLESSPGSNFLLSVIPVQTGIQ